MRLMMFALLCAAGLTGCTSNVALVTRAPLEDVDKVGLGFFSHTEGGGAQRNHKHYDNFALIRDSDVRAVRFWGLSDSLIEPGLNNFDQFVVEIYDADENNAPGELLYRQEVARDDSRSFATGRRGTGEEGAGRGLEFRHTVRFDEPLRLKKETTYFLCVAARRVDLDGDNWQWADGQRDDGISFSYAFDRGQMIRVDDTDSAMVIFGVAY